MDLISVIIPLYNKETSVSRCIESILSQTYSELEIIIIDDGSTDKSAQVVSKYLNDCRIRYVYKKNGGVSSARNLGITLANGEWITYIDADDSFLPEALSILLKTAKRAKTCISTANFYTERNGVRIPFCTGLKPKRISNNYRAWYFRSSVPGPGAALFHRDVLKGHRFNEGLRRYEDAEFLLDLLRVNDVAYSPDFVMIYYQDFSEASKATSSPESDFISHMIFEDKAFWERMVLASLLNEGLSIYGRELLMGKYNQYTKYIRYDCKIRRLKRWKQSIYLFLYKTLHKEK